MANNTVCHVEMFVRDMEAAQRFYGGIFSWQFQPFGPMVTFGTGTEHIGGFFQREDIKPGNTPSVWFDVHTIEDTLAKVTSLGGSVISGKDEVPGVGWSACFADPDGNPIGIVQFAGK